VGWGNTSWLDLAQDRDKWQALVNMAMNLKAPLNGGNFLTENQLAS
jgi:hypothetical protein